jgi:pimeloyl-ACP methyl ester carboxylesterase/class 3 adenylate cyclase
MPETRYARSGDVNIAYQVIGDGLLDIVFVMGSVSNIEYGWEEPSLARFLRRLASFSRLILFDKRGTGLSDRVSVDALPTFEQRMDDVRAVMDAVGSERAAVVGVSDGAAMCALFAATYPERTQALILVNPGRGVIRTPGEDQGRLQERLDNIRREWGGPMWVERYAPSLAHDERFCQWWATYCRMSASPGAAAALLHMNAQVNISKVLPAIRIPTLLVHRTDDMVSPADNARKIAAEIPGTTRIEVPGVDHLPFVGDQDSILNPIEKFLTGSTHSAEHDRVLATVLFSDIVGSSERAAQLGDAHWRELLADYYSLARRELKRFRGNEIKTTGDGFLATFDGPARAIRCACAVRDRVRDLGIEVRAGLHTGEVELLDEDVGGISVHIGARVTADAAPSEVLVSNTVKDLVAGSGIEFDDRGVHVLRGIPGEWRLFAVAPASIH